MVGIFFLSWEQSLAEVDAEGFPKEEGQLTKTFYTHTSQKRMLATRSSYTGTRLLCSRQERASPYNHLFLVKVGSRTTLIYP